MVQPNLGPEKQLTTFTGVHVAAVTPHQKEGHEPDFGAVLDLVGYLGSSGVQGIALLGSTGEFLHFTLENRIRLISLAVKRSRVPILAGTSHSTLDGAVELARAAISDGAAGLLVMPPYFFRYSQEDIKEFYLQFAAEVSGAVPILLYNIPFFTNEISFGTASDLLATGRFAGIKDSSGDLNCLGRLVTRFQDEPVSLLAGNDVIFTASRGSGVRGVVSGVACAVPELMLSLDRAIETNDSERIQRLEARLQEFIGWLDRFPAPVGLKVATAARGLKVGPLAVPLSPEKQKVLGEFRDWFNAWLQVVTNEAAGA